MKKERKEARKEERKQVTTNEFIENEPQRIQSICFCVMPSIEGKNP